MAADRDTAEVRGGHQPRTAAKVRRRAFCLSRKRFCARRLRSLALALARPRSRSPGDSGRSLWAPTDALRTDGRGRRAPGGVPSAPPSCPPLSLLWKARPDYDPGFAGSGVRVEVDWSMGRAEKPGTQNAGGSQDQETRDTLGSFPNE